MTDPLLRDLLDPDLGPVELGIYRLVQVAGQTRLAYFLTRRGPDETATHRVDVYKEPVAQVRLTRVRALRLIDTMMDKSIWQAVSLVSAEEALNAVRWAASGQEDE